VSRDGAETVDVLVVGCGPAGASAAIAAHDEGARVLVVEKRVAGGGNALFAGGFLWDVRGPDAVRHVETLFFGKTDQTVAQAYVTGLNNLPSWIAELGGEVVGVDPPPGSFPAVLPSWPHVPGSDGVRYWVVGGQPSLRRGEARWHLLSQNLTARGITVRSGQAAERLATSSDGRVTGAVVTSDDGSALVNASGGVVLACGGFEADDYFKDAFLPLPHLHRVGHDGNTRTSCSAGARRTWPRLIWLTCTRSSCGRPWPPRQAVPGVMPRPGWYAQTAQPCRDCMRRAGPAAYGVRSRTPAAV
jgi:choline dehydrogenase-like flavoprotein